MSAVDVEVQQEQKSFSDPKSKPPTLLVSLVVTILLLPVLAFIICISIPINIILWLLAAASSPFISLRLKSLEKNNWIQNTGKLYQSLTQKNSEGILIVGGGIGGLTLAHFLLKCGFQNVKVFEKHTDCGLDRGGGHGIISGRWCYDKMDMQEAFHTTCTRAHTWNFDSGRWWLKAKVWLQPLMHSNCFLPSLKYEPGSFVRSDMLAYLSKSLPPNVLHVNHELAEIQENSADDGFTDDDGGVGVKVTFTNGKTYRGSLLVGCDGSNSNVRKYICNRLDYKKDSSNSNDSSSTNDVSNTSDQNTLNTKNGGKEGEDASSSPFYVDINVWWCITPISKIPMVDLQKMTTNKFIWEPGPNRAYFESGAIMHLIAKDQLILVVDYRATSLKKHHKNWAGNATSEELVDFMKTWNIPNKFWPVAEHASRVSHFAIPKGINQDASSVWSMGRVAMLGDAVHPTPHFFGQGANAAIQDAYCLTRFICTADDLETAFKSYTAIRKPPARDIVSKSYILGLTETAGGIMRVIRDLIFFTVIKTGLFTWPVVDIMSVRV